MHRLLSQLLCLDVAEIQESWPRATMRHPWALVSARRSPELHFLPERVTQSPEKFGEQREGKTETKHYRTLAHSMLGFLLYQECAHMAQYYRVRSNERPMWSGCGR
jgi:hypothetical protein